jgi:hypothetical protein
MQHYSIINEMIGRQQMQKEKVESNDSEEEEFMAGQGTEEKSRSTSDCRETCPRTID